MIIDQCDELNINIMKAIVKTISALVVLCLLLSSTALAQESSVEVLKAYEERMQGNLEQATTILTNLLEKDSTNAMAHFEIARILDDSKKQTHITKALQYDPDNTMYHFYQANLYMLEAYKGMRGNQTTKVREHVEQCHNQLKLLLDLKPDCKESLLFLVEMYGAVPDMYGGDPEIATLYQERLKKVDQLYAAQGELVLAASEGSNIDMVGFWQQHIDQNGESLEGLIKLGKAQLMSNDIESATKNFKKVIKQNPQYMTLYLDIARAHLYDAMRAGDQADKDLKLFKKNINMYLDNAIKKPNLLQAWCYGWLGMIEQRQGNKDEADKYLSKAEELMPNFPRFTAVPTVDGPPNVIAYKYKSYFTPF